MQRCQAHLRDVSKADEMHLFCAKYNYKDNKIGFNTGKASE